MGEEHASAEQVWHASREVEMTVVATRLRLLHRERGGVCAECGRPWAADRGCPTIQIIEAGASPEARRAMTAGLTEHAAARVEALLDVPPAAE